MVCESCKKNHATVHLTEIINDMKKEMHLCEECARSKGVTQKFTFSVSDILGKFADVKEVGKVVKEMASLKCPHCGITYAEFRANARLGCANDYELFKPALVSILEKIHGSTQHIGKVPTTVDTNKKKETDLMKLKREMDRLVKVEDFEKAAEIRDHIKRIEDELKKGV